jgi:prepilin-type N-terminal cleavage/methylation domain-containing protein
VVPPLRVPFVTVRRAARPLAHPVLRAGPTSMQREIHGSSRAFTLVEAMVVVVLVGVLATLATYAVRNYVFASKTSEATSMLTSIKAAEEAYRDETFVYLDVSSTFAANNFHPSVEPKGNQKVGWGAGANATVMERFNTLGIQPDSPVMFSYAVVACGPGGACEEYPDLPTEKTKTEFNLPSAANRWGYVAIAKCDVNGDGTSGKYTYVVTHSYSNEIYVENEGQ